MPSANGHIWSKGKYKPVMPSPAGGPLWHEIIVKSVEFGLLATVCLILMYSLAP